MPCRCCGSHRPSKGFKEPGESAINDQLKSVAQEIKRLGFTRGDDNEDWYKEWIKCLQHHLTGCNEKDEE